MRTATNDPERTCILSGRTAPRDELIRLSLGPDGSVLPDPAAKAPGRGAWLGVDAADVRKAQASGKLKGALGRAFKGSAGHVPEDLAADIASGLERRALDQLGLAMKAGHVMTGFERLLSAAKSGQIALMFHAGDAAEDGTRKLDSALQSARPGAKSLTLPAGRDRLSAALGQGNMVHGGVTDAGAATRIEAAISRWSAFCGLEEMTGAASGGRAHCGM